MSEKKIFIESSLDPVPIEQTEIILNQKKECVCKIHIEGKKVFGFLVQVLYNNQLLRLLVANGHFLNYQDIMPDNTMNIFI